jgi:hypothetical protein
VPEDRSDFDLNGTIIEGTLQPRDLLPAFLSELQAIAPAEAERIERRFPELRRGPLVTDSDEGWREWCESERACDALVELEDALDAAAPPGIRFGAAEGDGSDFGFWPIDDEY